MSDETPGDRWKQGPASLTILDGCVTLFEHVEPGRDYFEVPELRNAIFSDEFQNMTKEKQIDVLSIISEISLARHQLNDFLGRLEIWNSD